MPFTEMGQTTFLCHSWLASSQTPEADGEKAMNVLRSDLEPVSKSRLGHGTISFATTREQVCLEPAPTSTSQAASLQTPLTRLNPAQTKTFFHWWPNVLDPLTRAWLPAGTKPRTFSYSSTSHYHQKQNKNPWTTTPPPRNMHYRRKRKKKKKTHTQDTKCTDMPDLVSSKTQMTTPKTSCE